MAAWIIGVVGAALSFWMGSNLGFSSGEVALQVAATNLAAFAGGILTLQAEKVTWVKTWVIPDGVRTWLFLAMLYGGIQLAMAPGLRDWEIYLRMALPLVMTTGLMLNPCFGPAQDWLVRRSQRRTREQAVSAS